MSKHLIEIITRTNVGRYEIRERTQNTLDCIRIFEKLSRQCGIRKKSTENELSKNGLIFRHVVSVFFCMINRLYWFPTLFANEWSRCNDLLTLNDKANDRVLNKRFRRWIVVEGHESISKSHGVRRWLSLTFFKIFFRQYPRVHLTCRLAREYAIVHSCNLSIIVKCCFAK